MILRARLVLPMAGPPIENGAIVISGERIRSTGAWTDTQAHATGEVVDMGEVVLLPGLINAHCHLDYTGMAGKISPPRSFADWIKTIVALKAEWSYTEFAESWLRGAEMLLRSGTTTVADVEAVPELLPDMWQATPLRVISFRELINLKNPRTAEQLVRETAAKCAALANSDGRIGLSPHAPYTTNGELLSVAAHEARKRGWLLTTHVAESEQETDMFMYRHGPLYDWLKTQRDMSDCGHGSPIHHLERSDYLGNNLLAVHVNYLWRDDAATLAKYGVSVVHCPRSHDYFRHLFFPRRELAAAGVNICLGTDSLASMKKVRGKAPELNMFAEMKRLAGNEPELAPQAILEMATINAARAIKREGDLGVLRKDALADVIAIPFSGQAETVWEHIVHFEGVVRASMIGGQWAMAAN
jgi:cytosine/adenosine deaminase-related metal-dependent hydrolase